MGRGYHSILPLTISSTTLPGYVRYSCRIITRGFADSVPRHRCQGMDSPHSYGGWLILTQQRELFAQGKCVHTNSLPVHLQFCLSKTPMLGR